MSTTADIGISSTEIVERLNGRITYRQLDYWVRIGRVTPSINDAYGTGDRRLWSADDLIVLDRILAMLERHEAEVARLSSGEMWDELHAEVAQPAPVRRLRPGSAAS